MQIKITVKGEPDTVPFTKNFQFQKFDDKIFTASCNKIKDTLAQNRLININETLLLFSAFVITSLKEGKNENQINKEVSLILSNEQVMIGVPEMLQHLDFEIILDGKKFTISINQPISVPNYMFNPAH